MNPFDRVLSIFTKPRVAAGVISFLVLSFLFIDQPLATYLYSLRLGINYPFLNWITNVGLGGVYFVSLFSLALFFRYIVKRADWEARAWFLWLCVVVPSLVCFCLKMLLGRSRPKLLFNDDLYGFYFFKTHAPFWSFPSGHSTTIMGLVFGLSILFPRYGYRFMFLGAVVAISRVLLTHHFLSDVLTASYLALLEVGLLYCVLRQRAWLEPAYRHAV